MIYQHPLGYLLGLQGIALMRAFNGEYDREFTEARIAEIREMLDHASEFGAGATTRPITTTEGYDVWAEHYDDPNDRDLLDLEEPIIRPIIDRRPIGPALDAACGTGRHAAYLASKGHSVIGVDGSAQMLAIAKAKVPGVDFRLADLRALPVQDCAVDLVTISLALTHVPELAPVMAEFARVLRPGGHLVIADSRMDYPLVHALPDGSYGYTPHYYRMTSEYLTAALPLGFEVRHCEELRVPHRNPADAPPAERVLPEHPSDIWTLRGWYPAAFYAALNGDPLLIFWDFELARP
ncbi:MAG TPA: class I SAM-dependent methyltransferase [Streptosporangiaceae bacterium]|nr:class I SAM-dependent methyltransferase [Streptosporangiaceae bacterium]